MRRSFKATVVAGTAIATMAIATGGAYAFITITGSGSGSQATIAKDAYKVDVAVSEVTDLTPGETQPVTVTVTNKGPSKVRIGHVGLSLPTTITGVDAAALGTVSVAAVDPQAPVILDANAKQVYTGSITIVDSATVDQTTLLGKSIVVTATVS